MKSCYYFLLLLLETALFAPPKPVPAGPCPFKPYGVRTGHALSIPVVEQATPQEQVAPVAKPVTTSHQESAEAGPSLQRSKTYRYLPLAAFKHEDESPESVFITRALHYGYPPTAFINPEKYSVPQPSARRRFALSATRHDILQAATNNAYHCHFENNAPENCAITQCIKAYPDDAKQCTAAILATAPRTILSFMLQPAPSDAPKPPRAAQKYPQAPALPPKPTVQKHLPAAPVLLPNPKQVSQKFHADSISTSSTSSNSDFDRE